MATTGMFGKVPSFGDFVSIHAGSPDHREFERWLEGSNDVMAERGQSLTHDPLGFLLRGATTRSLMIGILVGSVDSVGRQFPLALFYELAADGVCMAGLPRAMAPNLFRLARVARRSRAMSYDEVKEQLGSLELPVDKKLAVRTQAELHRLSIVPAELLLGRVYGPDAAPYYGCEVMLRACELAARRGSKPPIVIEGQVRTDVELAFLMGSIDAVSGGHQPQAVLWEANTRRALFVLGQPDQWLLSLMVGRGEADRLWPVQTSQDDVARLAQKNLYEACRTLLDDSGKMSSKEFLDALTIACKPRREQTAGGRER